MSCNHNCNCGCSGGNSCSDLYERMTCAEIKLKELSDKVFEEGKNILVFAAGTGVYANADYALGTDQVSLMNPDGVYLVGGISKDVVDESDAVTLGKNIQGFRTFFIQRKLWPVMGPTDWDLPTNGSLILDYFPYLPDAHRYYSVYYPESNTEVYVLSTARKSNGVRIYPTDEQLYQSQYNWLSVRAANSPAKNKIVVFNDPFSTVKSGAVDGTDYFTNFNLWDLEQWGINLIVNGQSGLSFALNRSYTWVVNPSSFITTSSTPLPSLSVSGDQGWVIKYRSTGGTENPPSPSPKNEIFVVEATKEGLKCKFISFDPVAPNVPQYEFNIPSAE